MKIGISPGGEIFSEGGGPVESPQEWRVIEKRNNAFEPGGLVEEAVEELRRCKHHPACGGCEKLIAELGALLPKGEKDGVSG